MIGKKGISVTAYRARFPLLAVGGLSLLAALWAGLLRLGWTLPLPGLSFPANHGPFMIVGFLGTLISLERAVALKRAWPYGAPLLAGLSALLLPVGGESEVSPLLAVGAGLFLIFIFFSLFRQQPSDFLLTLGLAASLWFVGNLLWYFGYPLHQLVPWWAGFLVLTISGERLELSRLMRLTRLSRGLFLAAVGLCILGLALSLWAFPFGIRLAAVALLVLALWLFRCDIAWRTVLLAGLPRYMAVSLLAGYVWLCVGAVLWFFFAGVFVAGFTYDAMLHSIFLGFVFSMIFAHAPIILPAVTGFAMPFRKSFYGHLGLLHLSLILRVGADLAYWNEGRMWGGLFNALAILLFLASSMLSVRAGRFENDRPR